MEYAQKMLLVPAETFKKIHNIQDNNAPENEILSLDKEMAEVINSKLDDYSKWTKYQQILQRYLHFVKKNNEPLALPIIEESQDLNKVIDNDKQIKTEKEENYYDIENIIETLPKSDQNKGRMFLKKIKDSNISWNKLGMVNIDGQNFMPNSNIIDLVNDFVRKRRRASQLHGSDEFSYALKKINMPSALIGNTYYRDVLREDAVAMSPQATPVKIKEDAKFVWRSLPKSYM